MLLVLGACKADPAPQSGDAVCEGTGGGVTAEVPFDGIDNDCDDSTPDQACERGLAGWIPANGSPQEISATLEDRVVLDEPGVLTLCEGTWPLRIEIEADGVTLMGDGADRTVIDAGGRGRVVHAGDGRADIAIRDLTLTGGVADQGGGLFAADTALTLAGVDVAANTAEDEGGGAYVVGGSLSLSGGSFSGNLAGREGGGLYVDDLDLTADGVTFSSNSSERAGGGMAVADECDDVILTDVTFVGNAAASSGGGLYATAEVTISEASFRQNAGSNGGAISAIDGLTLSDAVLDSNEGRDGGGIYVSAERRTDRLERVEFNNNQGSGGTALFARIYQGGAVTCTDCFIRSDDDDTVAREIEDPTWIRRTYDFTGALDFTCDEDSCR